MTAALQVVDPGVLTLVEDLGRPGNAAIGLSRSGALDRGTLRLANRIVGNPEGAAGLEVLVGGLAVCFTRPTWFAVTGALGELRLDPVGSVGMASPSAQPLSQPAAGPTRPTPVEPNAAALAPAGSVLRLGPAIRGLRYYLAVRGGIDVPVVIGSRSTDTLSGVGGPPLQAGDTVPVGAEPATDIPALDALTVAPPASGIATVYLHPGPRADWFTAAALARFFDTVWAVSPDADRIGLRIEAAGAPGSPGPRFERVIEGELPSEAMVPGAIQVSPSGRPTVLLADHPVTGGYPVIAVVADASLDAFAQLRPGQRITFRHSRR